MEDKDIIKKIQQLRQVKPRKDWVVLTKQRILEEEKFSVFILNELILGLRLIFQHKLAFATFALVLIILGTFGFAQNSVPGNILFSVKKMSERGRGAFASDKLGRNFDITNKRLEELTQIAEENDVSNLAPAINEYQVSVSETAESIGKEIKENPQATKGIVGEIKSLAQKTGEIRSLGVEIPENREMNEALVQMLKTQVEDLENRSLMEEDIVVLEEIKKAIEEGRLDQALEKLVNI